MFSNWTVAASLVPALMFVGFGWPMPMEGAQEAAGPVRATILAAGRGERHLFLRDGQKVPTTYSGSSVPDSHARPTALASADFDEDGMPDLASGYAAADGTGIVTIHRGNANALWPYGKAADPPAFLPDARVFALPVAPDFLGAGDFDADGHWDLVAAHAGDQALYLLHGDGHGGFSTPERIDLPGAVTAFTTGEINRVDGLTDIAVGVEGQNGAQVLVFESPAGALRGEPEVFPVAHSISALVMMPLDGDPLNDLAVGAGRELVAIHGRDRMLSGARAMREGAAAAKITRQVLPFAVRALAAGHFTSTILDLAALGDDGKVHFLERSDAAYQATPQETPASLSWKDGRLFANRGSRAAPSVPNKPETQELVLRDEIAVSSPSAMELRLVTAHTSITQTDDLIAADRGASQLHVLSRSAETRSMHIAASLDTMGAPAAVLPMRLTPSSVHSLVVLHAGQLEPSVSIATTPNTFTVTTTVDPGPSDPVMDPLNANGPGSLRWAISNALVATGPSLINFNIPLTDPNYDPQSGTFTFTPTPTNGCLTNGFLKCLLLPFLPGGLVIDGYSQPGASPNTLTGGDNAVLKIVLNGAKGANIPVNGLELLNGVNTIRGLVINGLTGQTDSTGTTNNGGGINQNSSFNFLEGNFVGTDSAGGKAVPNVAGIARLGNYAGPNVVGGTVPQARNLLSGNRLEYGSLIAADPNTDFFQGNYVGTDRTGTSPIGGAPAAPQGLNLEGKGLVVGGPSAGAVNLISGMSTGVLFISEGPDAIINPDSNIVQANLIGTDLTGTLPIPNVAGVIIEGGQFNLLGGTTPSVRNVISGNTEDGVEVYNESTFATVQGNYIGVDISGIKALPNSRYGVNHTQIDGALNAIGTLIGGESPGAGNVISNSFFFGIAAGGATQTPISSFSATILGNLIGTDATGSNAMANGEGGIQLVEGASNYIIGGTDTPARNIIANNNGPGILIDPAVSNPYQIPVGSNSVIGNAIYSNTGPGVWLHSGVNNTVSENSIYSNGGLGIDLDALGHLVNSSCQSATNGANNLQNAPVLTGTVGGGTLVSATATDPSGNTSEFSNCVPMASTGNLLNLVGTFNGLANTKYTIEFFQNTACDPTGYGQGKTFLNRISVSSGSNCSVSVGNSPDVTKADLSVQLSYDHTKYRTSVTYQSLFAYQAIVTNNGVSNAASVSLTDTLPASVILNSVSPTQGTCGNSGNAVTCSLGTLASGASAVVTMNVTINAVGTIADTASASSTTTDPNLANNTATLSLSSSYPLVSLSHLNPFNGVAGYSGATSNDNLRSDVRSECHHGQRQWHAPYLYFGARDRSLRSPVHQRNLRNHERDSAGFAHCIAWYGDHYRQQSHSGGRERFAELPDLRQSGDGDSLRSQLPHQPGHEHLV